MPQLILLLLLSLSFTAGFAQTTNSFKGTQTDTYFGINVADPYRKLEDTGNVQVKAWMKKEAAKADAFFATLPNRSKIKASLINMYEQTKIDEINKVQFWKGKYYVTKRKNGQENYTLYEIDSSGKEKLLL